MIIEHEDDDVLAWSTPTPAEAAERNPDHVPAPPKKSNVDDDDFAPEVAPKETEFSTKKDAKAATGEPFDAIP